MSVLTFGMQIENELDRYTNVNVYEYDNKSTNDNKLSTI